MSILVSGILKSPTGAVIAGAQITLTALTTSPDLLAGVSASAVTSDTGYYGLNVLPGAYSLTVAVNGKSQVYGSFRLDGTETTVTLNMVLRRNLVEVSIPDALLVDFRQIQNNVADDLEAMRQLEFRASGSADNAARSAADAKVSAEASARSEANAADSEKSAEQFAQNLQDAVTKAGDSASDAASSSTAAEKQAVSASGSAEEAKQSALTAKQAATTAANDAAEKIKLPLINAIKEVGEKVDTKITDLTVRAEAAATGAGISENNAASSARAARTSEINAAGSVAKAAASAAAALVSQNAAKTSEDAASASAVKASVSEVNAYYSAAAALASQKAAKVSEGAAKASQIASTASADSASASAMSAQGNATRSTQAATDAIAAKDAAAAQVTGFDEYVSQQVTVITEVAASATTKANADIAAATDISRNNAIQAINQKQAEATDAIQASVDTAVTTAQTAALSASASQVAATASASGANTSAIAAQASATAAKASQDAAALSEVNAGKSATDAQAYVLTVTQQAAQIQSTATEIANQGRLVTEQSLRTQENAEKVARSELNIQQKASTVEFAFNKLGPLVIDPVTGASVDISAKLSGFATRAETAATSAETSNNGAQKALEEAKLIAKTPGKDGAPGKSAYDIWKESQPAGADTSMAAYMAIYGDIKNLRNTNIGGKSVPFILVERAQQITDLPTGTFVEVQGVSGLLPLIDGAYLSVIANDFGSNRNAFVLYGKGSGRVWTGYRADSVIEWKELGSKSGAPLPGEVGSYVFAEADGGGPGFGGEIEGEWLHPTAHIDGDFWMNEGTLLTGTWVAAGYFLDVSRQKTLFMRIR